MLDVSFKIYDELVYDEYFVFFLIKGKVFKKGKIVKLI